MLSARAVALSLLCSAAALACAEDSEQPVFLGAAGSASFEAPPTYVPGAGGAAGAAGAGGAAGAPSACPLTLSIPAPEAATALERSGDGYTLAVGAELRALSGSACPAAAMPSTSPGVGAVRALAIVDGVSFVAGASAVRAGAAACPGGGLVSLAREGSRAVGLSPDGTSLARLTRSTVTKKDGSGKDVQEDVCEREDVPLAGGARALSLGASSVPGTVWASFAPATGPVFAARVDAATGVALTSVKLSSLCTADAFVDLGSTIAVLDATCPRVALFDAKGARLADRSLAAMPRAIAPAADDSNAIVVARAVSTPPSARLEFQRLSLADLGRPAVRHANASTSAGSSRSSSGSATPITQASTPAPSPLTRSRTKCL